MASAMRKTVEIEKVVKTTEDVIVLELTREETEAVAKALGMFECDSIQFGILKALNAPAETDDRPIQVGDKVRITDAGEGDGIYINEVGKVDQLDKADIDLPFLVILPDHDYVWVKSVERVND